VTAGVWKLPRELALRFAATVLSPRAYPFILALGAVLIVIRLVHEFSAHDMSFKYLEYLPTYDFEFIRRGFIGHLLSLGLPQLTHLHVKTFAVALVCVTIAAYCAMYAFRFGFSARELPLLACTVASPAVFKNAAYDFGRLDICGFLVGVLALALPLNGLYALVLGALCCVLMLIHEAQFLTYVPVIAAIAAIRMAATGRLLRHWLSSALAVAAILVTFLLVLRYGSPEVPPAEMLARLKLRAADPVVDRVFLWYIGPVTNLIAASQPDILWPHVLRIPKYALLLLAHLPLLIFAWRETAALPKATRTMALLGFAAVTVCVAAMFVLSHDKARWFANWLAGMILVMHAVRLVRRPDDPDPTLQTPLAVAAAWLMAAISRIGLMTPL